MLCSTKIDVHQSTLLRIAPEVRNRIYELCVGSEDITSPSTSGLSRYFKSVEGGEVGGVIPFEERQRQVDRRVGR